jgi:hypothetical protein
MANQSLDHSLRFVQVDSDVAYIDSRVYCREVIQVDHRYWMQDTLYKHKNLIEQHFGAVRFETAPVLTDKGVANNTQKYALLTEPQCGFALTLSRNTTKTMQRKAELIADFERAKALVRLQLEQQFKAQPESQIASLSNALNNFPNTLDKVWKTSGIVNKSQVKKAILRDFVEERDYVWAGNKLCINDSTFHILIISFRSLAGADIEKLPEIIHLKTREYFQYQAAKKMNRRIAQNSEWEQLSLFM